MTESRPLPSHAPPASAHTADVDCRFLESLVGYHARRASLRLVGVFAQAVQGTALKVVEFSMLSLIQANPGITSRRLCHALDVLPPNAVPLVNQLIHLRYVAKHTLAHDRRATGLYATPQGQALALTLQARIAHAEDQHLHALTAQERQQLMALLQKTYSTPAPHLTSKATPCNTTT